MSCLEFTHPVMPSGLDSLTYSCGGYSLTQLLYYEGTLLSHEDGSLDSSKSFEMKTDSYWSKSLTTLFFFLSQTLWQHEPFILHVPLWCSIEFSNHSVCLFHFYNRSPFSWRWFLFHYPHDFQGAIRSLHVVSLYTSNLLFKHKQKVVSE